MTCTPLVGSDGKVIGWACGSRWGMGVTTLYGEDAEALGGSVYGFGHDGTDPHDFFPDYESNTPEEIAAWEQAKAECTVDHEGSL